MSMHTQLLRGLLALPVAALLLVAGAIAPQAVALPCDAATADAAPAGIASPVALPRTVEFHSMLPGALHIVKRVKVSRG
jgi:hypothetical protein